VRFRALGPFVLFMPSWDETTIGFERRASEMHAVEKARRMLVNGIYLQRMLGGRGLAGLALMVALYAGDPWQTVQQIAEAADMSEDTVRRRMNDLVQAGRVRERDESHRKLYAINPDIARTIMQRVANENVEFPTESQDAVADCN